MNESHHIALADMSGSLGSSPWRSTYEQLNLFRLLLNKSTSFMSFSAMITPYVEHILDHKLSICTNQIKFQTGLNWPNICYTLHDIVDSELSQEPQFSCPKCIPPSHANATHNSILWHTGFVEKCIMISMLGFQTNFKNSECANTTMVECLLNICKLHMMNKIFWAFVSSCSAIGFEAANAAKDGKPQ